MTKTSLIAVAAALSLAGCATYTPDRPGYQPTGAAIPMTREEARAYVHDTLLMDPVTKRPMFTYCENGFAGEITGVSVTAREIVISSGLCTLKKKIKDVNPRLLVSGDGSVTRVAIAATKGDRGTDPVLERFIDALVVLRDPGASPLEQARFAEAAAKYRAAAFKPELPEEARRFKVQAEGAVVDKQFQDAADFYEQALQVAPWWPEGRYNRAMVLSEVGDYDQAIMEIKRYLALVPDAPNARAAQDKVYDWERKAAAAEKAADQSAERAAPAPSAGGMGAVFGGAH